MTTINEPLISIIIINFNGKSFLQKCLESIYDNEYLNYEIILVDNHSDDQSVPFVKANYPKVRITSLEKNFGFAEPNNIGAKQARGNFLYFLNNDTIISKDSLKELVKSFNDIEISIAQSLLLNEDNSIDSSGDFITTNCIAYSSQENSKTIKPIFSPRGAAFMIKKGVFWELDGFDEKFFASFEDVDLGWRAWLCGYKVVLVPKSIVHHMGGQTVKKLETEIQFHGIKNTLILSLTNFETNYSIKCLFSLLGLLFQKKISIKDNLKTSKRKLSIPSFKILFRGILWIIKNSGYVRNKRNKINSKRVISTKELIRKGLIKN